MKEFIETPKDRKRRDLLLFSTILLIITPTLVIIQYNSTPEKVTSQLPNIYIRCNQAINSENYIPSVIELNECIFLSNIKYRGKISVTFPKKGYRLELKGRHSLLGMRIDDDWQLIANYLDHTRMRTKLAFDLWRALLPSNPTAILPESIFLKLFINNEFQGLYLLSERTDRRLFGLNDSQNNLNTSLLLQVPGHHYNFEELVHWEQDYPNEEDGIYIADQIIEDLIFFMKNTSNEEFFNVITGIFSKFDKKNLIDFYLFNFFIHHKNFWSNNYYLVRNSMPSKFFLIPWDFDGSFGQMGWKKYNSNSTVYFGGRNLLYKRLFHNKEFMQEVKTRWAELRADLWTKEYIFGIISKIYNQIQEILEIELEMWKPITVEGYISPEWPDECFYSNEEFDLNEAIQFLYNWTEERLQFCDLYFAL
ncbi:MAG: CotH kinase family protein [Candidatus Lokiarchaeota archaeon]|nr:CotH kinase family protein [Candidatus Lokiarchaeota archaeon]